MNVRVCQGCWNLEPTLSTLLLDKIKTRKVSLTAFIEC